MNVPLRLHGSICKRRGLKLHGIFGAAGENMSGKQESRGYGTFMYIYIYDLYQINGIRCVMYTLIYLINTHVSLKGGILNFTPKRGSK